MAASQQEGPGDHSAHHAGQSWRHWKNVSCVSANLHGDVSAGTSRSLGDKEKTHHQQTSDSLHFKLDMLPLNIRQNPAKVQVRQAINVYCIYEIVTPTQALHTKASLPSHQRHSNTHKNKISRPTTHLYPPIQISYLWLLPLLTPIPSKALHQTSRPMPVS